MKRRATVRSGERSINDTVRKHMVKQPKKVINNLGVPVMRDLGKRRGLRSLKA